MQFIHKRGILIYYNIRMLSNTIASWFKKILLLTFILFGSFFEVSGAHAQTLNSEQITNYDIALTLSPAGYVDVVETIRYDFGVNQKHGILRTIPRAYRNADGTYYLPKFTIRSVTDERGAGYPYQVTPQGTDLLIRIGDPGITVTGAKTYIVKYRALGVVSYFASSTELYWNAIGTEWNVPILAHKIRVSVPTVITSSTCYTGTIFSTSTDCKIRREGRGVAEFTSLYPLNSQEGVTVVVGMPGGSIAKPPAALFVTSTSPLSSPAASSSHRVSIPPEYTPSVDAYPLYTPSRSSPWLWVLPGITFIIYFYLWWRSGREPQGRGTVIAEYEPPDNLTPIQIGTVIDGRTDNRDLSAQLIHLAVRGYLKIKEQGKREYVFISLKDPMKLSGGYEQKLLTALFKEKDEVLLSELEYTFYTTAQEIKQAVRKEIVQLGYLNPSPYTSSIKFGCLGWVVMTVILIGLGSAALFKVNDIMVAWVLSSIVIGMFTLPLGRFFTKKGSEARERILGFKLFLSVTEKDRLKFFNAPEKKPELFEKYLPYAMVLGVEREWARQFEGLYSAPPEWYEGDFTTGFTMAVLAGHLASFSTTSGATLTSTLTSEDNSGGSFNFPSTPNISSGFSGGSSGGGFGGGGGGSW